MKIQNSFPKPINFNPDPELKIESFEIRDHIDFFSEAFPKNMKFAFATVSHPQLKENISCILPFPVSMISLEEALKFEILIIVEEYLEEEKASQDPETQEIFSQEIEP